MTFTKEATKYSVSGDWYIIVRAYVGGRWVACKYAIHTGELAFDAACYLNNEEQAKFLMSQVPDGFLLLPERHDIP